ncbi:hypothetical protein MMA86_25360, partial [Salmonella enterica]|nr:hypothetical protein [Salmonella enterica]
SDAGVDAGPGAGGVPAPIAATIIAANPAVHRIDSICASPRFRKYSDAPAALKDHVMTDPKPTLDQWNDLARKELKGAAPE